MSTNHRKRSELRIGFQDSKPYLQLPNAESLLKDVGCVRASSQASHGGQVAAVASHRLHDEDAALRPRRRLFDPVAGLRRPEKRWRRSAAHKPSEGQRGTYGGDGVEGRVGADAEVRAGDVVGDGGGDDHHGDTHLFVLLPGLNQLQTSHVGLRLGVGVGVG